MAAAAVAAVLVVSAIALVAFYAPVDQDGLNQKIFYFHVPIALTAYACFGLGALKGFLYLWKGGDERDLESYVAVHQGVIFGPADARHGLDLGQDQLGTLVGVG